MSPHEARDLVQTGTLTGVTGIGPATASVITELVATGASRFHQEVQGEYPSSLMELGDVPRLSMKQIQWLHDRAGIRSIADLHKACLSDRLCGVKGFGPKVQAKLLTALGEYQRGQGYHLYANVLEEATTLAKELATIPGVTAVSPAGAIRRKLEVIREFVFVVHTMKPTPATRLAQHVMAIPNITDVSDHRDIITARSPLGLPVTIQVAPREHYAFALLHATGSAEHLDELQQRLVDKGFPDWTAIRTQLNGSSVTEEHIYRAAGLSFIPPELREGRGEIRWASTEQSPSLVEATQIQGIFHVHTVYTDGADTVEEMVVAARACGYRYIGISDHSQAAFYVNGLKEDRIRAQWEDMDSVQRKYPDIRIFKGIEADILPDGSMDYRDAVLAQFDFVIASVHSRFNLSEEDQTRRICRALTNPYVTMLGHPTGRLLLSRTGYRVDMSRIIQTAAAHRKIIEINGSRHRLDLDWRWARVAKQQGVRFCINPDAHAVNELSNVALGVNVARKAALAPEDVVNTYPVADMKSILRATRT
jgi:DNA polymerase (family 10)